MDRKYCAFISYRHLPLDTAVAENLTVVENLHFMAQVYGLEGASKQQWVNDMVAQFRLEEVLNSRAKTLSGGWKRKLSIAMALISQPRVLFLDDCTRIQDFSPLGDLPELEALRIEWCRKADRLWDMSGNTSLKVLSIHDAKKIVTNPTQIQTSQTLEEIRLWGADFDNKYTLESLSCFQGMKSLKRIDLNMMKLQNRNLDILATLPMLEEFHFDAGMLTTEEIAWICAKHPNLYGDCLGVYTTNEVACLNDIRICGHRKPGLDLPKDQKRLDKYTSEFNALVKKYRDEA